MDIRTMTIDDYDKVRELWMSIKGFAIRSIDDSREGIEKFLNRNPQTSVVAIIDGKVVGSILCGHDGRHGTLYHVCVALEYRNHGIGKAMVEYALAALNKEGISSVSLIAFTENDLGNAFWKHMSFTMRKDCNYYSFVLNKDNKICYNE